MDLFHWALLATTKNYSNKNRARSSVLSKKPLDVTDTMGVSHSISIRVTTSQRAQYQEPGEADKWNSVVICLLITYVFLETVKMIVWKITTEHQLQILASRRSTTKRYLWLYTDLIVLSVQTKTAGVSVFLYFVFRSPKHNKISSYTFQYSMYII